MDAQDMKMKKADAQDDERFIIIERVDALRRGGHNDYTTLRFTTLAREARDRTPAICT